MSLWKPTPDLATAPRTGIEPVFACGQRCASEPGATTNSCRLGVNMLKALRPGIAPDLRASKAHVASTRRRESRTLEASAAGIEPASKRLTVALPCQHRTHRIISVRTAGFEPAISCFRNTRDAELPHVLFFNIAPSCRPWRGLAPRNQSRCVFVFQWRDQ